MFFCRKCLIAAAAAPKVLTPILVPAATLTEEEEEEEEEEGENEDSTPKMINASRNTPRTTPTIPPTNPTTKPNKTRMIAITKSILIVWRSLFPNKNFTFAYTMILEHVYSNALPYLIIESVIRVSSLLLMMMIMMVYLIMVMKISQSLMNLVPIQSQTNSCSIWLSLRKRFS